MKRSTISFCRNFVVLAWLSMGLARSPAFGLDLLTVYSGDCQFKTGFILKSEAQRLVFLTLDGAIVAIPRYDVSAITIYSVPTVEIADPGESSIKNAPGLFTFYTFSNGVKVPMATGWPIGYTKESIQLLSPEGKEFTVIRDRIWGVHAEDVVLSNFKRTNGARKLLLRHPIRYETCRVNHTRGTGEALSVIAEQSLEDPVLIKRMLDHLREGYRKVEEYYERQTYYAVPQKYHNKTRLGTWTLVSSRYTNVGGRRINFLPLVEDELSEGPFSFQRVIKSGVAPILWSVQDEPNLQVFYGMKADYIHAELFVDPMLILIGNRYDWSRGQLNRHDDRLVETGGLEFGIDIGNVSLMLVTVGGRSGLRHEEDFGTGNFSTLSFGASYQSNHTRLLVYSGSAEVDIRFLDKTGGSWNLSHRKVILETPLTETFKTRIQWLTRSLDNQKKISDKPAPVVKYQSTYNTVSGQLDWDLSYRWTVSTLIAVESQKIDSGPTGGSVTVKNAIFPKASFGLGIGF
jgi:hypothetical protein